MAVLEGNVLNVSGTTNLMDGTNGVISVAQCGRHDSSRGQVYKRGEGISHDFTVGDDWQDIVYGFITFDTQQADKQPKEVTNAYGKKFENLTGESIIWDLKGVAVVLQSEGVEIG